LINFYLLHLAAFTFGGGWYIAGAEPLGDQTGGRGNQMQSGASGDLMVA
jgi:hypothetical protein